MVLKSNNQETIEEQVSLDLGLEVERVDIDAERTRIITIAIRIVGRPESIVGTTES